MQNLQACIQSRPNILLIRIVNTGWISAGYLDAGYLYISLHD